VNLAWLKVALVRRAVQLAVAIVPAKVWALLLVRRTVRKPSVVPLQGADPLRILALSHTGFRGDLEALANSGRAEVYLFPPQWQTRFVLAFYGAGRPNRHIMNPPAGSSFEDAKRRIAQFYERILKSYLRSMPCDCVVSFHFRTPADIDLARAAMAAGLPYCTIFREGLIASSEHIKRHMRLYFERLGRFQGNHFLVHSTSARDLCIAEGFSRPNQTWALGCIRMDGFLRDIATGGYRSGQATGTATLFPPTHYVLTQEEQDGYLREFYVALLGFFARNRQYRLVIKPKAKQLSFEQALVKKALEGSGLNLDQIVNVEFNATIDAHEAIRQSDVILGLNSTTLLEAGIAGRPVIAPLFTVLEQDSAREAIRFADAYQYFDVARDGTELQRLLDMRLADPSVDEVMMHGRRAMFEKYVTKLDGNAVDRYLRFLGDLSGSRATDVRTA